MSDVVLKDQSGNDVTYENVNAVLLNTVDGGTATYVNENVIPVQVQADWEQTDETAVDFIKNKPTSFGGDYTHPNTHPASMITGLVVKDLPSLEIASYEFIYSDTFGCYMYTLPKAWDDLLGTTYKITWDGEEYTRVCRDINEINETMSGSYYIGNPAKITNMNIGEDTGEPFFILFSYGEGYIFTDDSSNSHRFGITPIDEVKKLDSKYLPDGLATQEWVNNEISKIDTGSGSGGNTSSEIDLFERRTTHNFVPEPDAFNLYSAAYVFPDVASDGEYTTEAFTVEIGKTYMVEWDGEEYKVVAQDANDFMPGSIGLGNLSLAGLNGNNEPFAIGVMPDMFVTFISLLDEESLTHTVRIYQKVEASVGVTWDDITEIQSNETDLFAKQTVNRFESDSSYGGIYTRYFNFPESGFTNDIIDSFTLTIGESYTVEWDGIEYVTVAQDASAVLADVVIIGNGFSFGLGEDTGEPFVIAAINGAGVSFASLTEQVESHTVRIYKVISETNVIKRELLPQHLQFGEVNDTFTLIDGTYKSTYTEDSGWMSETIPITSDIHLTEGETYTVLWNGTEYSCVAFSAEGMTLIGNAAGIGGDDSGEPFLAVEDTNGAITGNVGFIFMTEEPADSTVTTEVAYDIKVTWTGERIKKIDSKYLPQVDWNNNDVFSANYIKNRPFGMIPAGTVMAERTSVDCNLEFSENEYVALIPTVGFIPGVTYRIELDGMSADLTAEDFGEVGIGVVVGGRSIIDNFNNSAITILVCTTQGTHTYKVTVIEDAIKKIDPKYLPDDIGGSSLPEVTTANNGQVMTVVDGVWTAQTPASGLPTVTSSDTGKFLRVDSSGNWVAETIPNAEEVSF